MALPASGPISLLNIQTEFGGVEPIAITEYYGVGSSGVTPKPLGLSPSLFSVSGNNAVWTARTIDVSAYEGHVVRPVFLHYRPTYFTGDMQLDMIGFDSSLESFETLPTGWQTTGRSTASYNSATWYSLGTGTTAGYWNRDSGGTGSGSTGLTNAASGSWYVYSETSTYYSTTTAYQYYLRGPQHTVGANSTFKFSEARYGSGMGTLLVYFDVISQPTTSGGAPSSGEITLSDFYGLAAPVAATSTFTPDDDASLETVYTYLEHERKGFGAQGKCDFLFPESVGGTHDDAFGSLTNVSGLISGADVTSISATQLVSSNGSRCVQLQAQGSSLSQSSFSSIEFNGYLPSASATVTRTLTSSTAFFGVPFRLNEDGVPNMVQWYWLDGLWSGVSRSNSIVPDIWSMISYAVSNSATITITVNP